MGMLFLRFQFEYSEFIFTLSPTQSFMVSLDIIIMGTILLAGIIGTSRMYLKAHSPIQLYGGYFVGAISHVIAYIAFIR
jgi:membrane-associated phospholipid phosphatase